LSPNNLKLIFTWDQGTRFNNLASEAYQNDAIWEYIIPRSKLGDISLINTKPATKNEKLGIYKVTVNFGTPELGNFVREVADHSLVATLFDGISKVGKKNAKRLVKKA
jgi:hypothetical protein